MRIFNANKSNAAATGYVVQAAYHAYKLRLAGRTRRPAISQNTMQSNT